MTEITETATEETEAPKTKPSALTDDIREAFNQGVAESKSEDSIKIDMIAAGAKFKNVTKLYNDLMIEGGYALSKEDKEVVLENATKDRDLLDEADFDKAVEEINAAVESTNEKGAATMLRAYARKNNIEYFKKPKAESTGGNRNTFISDYYEAILANPKMTKDEASAFIKDHCEKSGSQNPARWESSHQKVRELANKIAESYAS